MKWKSLGANWHSQVYWDFSCVRSWTVALLGAQRKGTEKLEDWMIVVRWQEMRDEEHCPSNGRPQRQKKNNDKNNQLKTNWDENRTFFENKSYSEGGRGRGETPRRPFPRSLRPLHPLPSPSHVCWTCTHIEWVVLYVYGAFGNVLWSRKCYTVDWTSVEALLRVLDRENIYSTEA